MTLKELIKIVESKGGDLDFHIDSIDLDVPGEECIKMSNRSDLFYKSVCVDIDDLME